MNKVDVKKLNIFIVVVTILFFTLKSGGAFAFDSLKDYEEKTRDGFWEWFKHIDTCIGTGKAVVPFMVSDFDNASIPHVLSVHNKVDEQQHATWSEVVTVGRIAAYVVLFEISGPLALLALGVDVLMYFDVCTNAFIVMPNEYVNLYLDRMKFLGCGGAEQEKKPDPLSSDDVPFFYHCEADWDPDKNSGKGGKITKKDPGECFDGLDEDGNEKKLSTKECYQRRIGKTWGYMGSASIYCNNDYGQIIKGEYQVSGLTPKMLKDNIGGAVIYYRSLWSRMFDDSHDKCKGIDGYKDYDRWVIKPKPGGASGEGVYQFFAYYTYSTENSKVQLCVAAPYTLTPVKVGCTYVPPPSSDNSGLLPFDSLIEGTRCEYLIAGREDLHSLGKHLSQTDDDGRNRTAILKFLKSDLHVTSTVVGCILDLLDKLFFAKDDNCNKVGDSFFEKVQRNFKPLVFTVLTLYLVLIGLKIMTSPTPPQRSEFIMYVVKFGLVLYFAIGTAWYEYDSRAKKEVGIYPGLIDGSQLIASFFLGAQNENDPIGYCKYNIKYKTKSIQLLSQIDFPISEFGPDVVPTAGTCKQSIRMTMWDLIDCKIINYINFGSCDYTLTGLIGAWMVTAVILLGGIGIILFIGSFIYCFMILKIIFKFTHIFVLSMFTITILVLVSPVILCFGLFGYTKGIFDKWLSILLGYMIYPALNFAFIALMLATFDSIYYGNVNPYEIYKETESRREKNHDSTITVESTAKDICQKNASAFCILYRYVDLDDLCRENFTNIVKRLVNDQQLWLIGTFTVLNKDLAISYLQIIWHLCLFAFLFYLLMNAVDNFMALLAGVIPLGSEIPTKGDLSKYAKKGFGVILNLATAGVTNMASKGLGSIKGNMASGGGSKDKGGEKKPDNKESVSRK